MAGEVDRSAKFVSQKINKVRWQPISKHVTLESTTFATGSWDNDVNCVSVWSTIDVESEYDTSPFLLCEAAHSGDVTDLRYVNYNHILASSSLGSICMYKHHMTNHTLSAGHHWENVHCFPSGQPASCTSIAIRGEEEFASVGEDGQLAVYDLKRHQPLRKYPKADSCTLNDVLYLKQNEIAAVNSIGQMKVWDTRVSGETPVHIFLITLEKVALNCLDKHPSQPHVVMTGGEDGTLCIWDMRQAKFPVTLLSAHSSDMWEVCFHPASPDNLFTCSQDGSVWHWDSSAISANASLSRDVTSSLSKLGTPSFNLTMPPKTPQATSSWLASEATKHRMDITDLLPENTMPVNSIDISNTTLLCGTDGEQIITVKNLVIK